jgi:hypothetical protein
MKYSTFGPLAAGDPPQPLAGAGNAGHNGRIFSVISSQEHLEGT